MSGYIINGQINVFTFAILTIGGLNDNFDFSQQDDKN